MREKERKIIDHRTAIFYDGLGMLLDGRGHYTEAQTMRMAAYNTERKYFGLRNRGTAAALSNLGICLARQRRYGEGLEFVSQALNILWELCGPDDLLTNAATFNVYQILKRQKRVPQGTIPSNVERDLLNGAEKVNSWKLISITMAATEQVMDEVKKLAGL